MWTDEYTKSANTLKLIYTFDLIPIAFLDRSNFLLNKMISLC